ncbi:MAG TPA: hypothetical protein PLF41_11640 [Anaerolineales bacterium]|jgi:hypothetical protein|nr:hypothetical protein [Anaerolineales bacterium]
MISKRKSKDKNSETQQDKKLNASINEALKSLKKMRRNEIPRNSNQIYKIGSARTTLFLNDFLPQVYLTLVSVLQGVALSALINEFEYGLTSLVTYGYIISSFLIIVAFWHSYLSAIFDGRWPFRFVDTLLFFMAASAETIAVRNVDIPIYWCVSIGFMCLIISVIYFRQISLLTELVVSDLFEDPHEGASRIKAVKRLGVGFVVAAMTAFLFAFITQENPKNLFAPLVAIVIPISYIVLVTRGAARFGVDAIG